MIPPPPPSPRRIVFFGPVPTAYLAESCSNRLPPPPPSPRRSASAAPVPDRPRRSAGRARTPSPTPPNPTVPGEQRWIFKSNFQIDRIFRSPPTPSTRLSSTTKHVGHNSISSSKSATASSTPLQKSTATSCRVSKQPNTPTSSLSVLFLQVCTRSAPSFLL